MENHGNETRGRLKREAKATHSEGGSQLAPPLLALSASAAYLVQLRSYGLQFTCPAEREGR